MENKHTDKEIGASHGEKFESRWFAESSKPRFTFFFRAGPIPETGKHRWRGKSWYRHNRFIRTRRWNQAHIEFGFTPRKKGKEYIPDPWDDVPRERQKSWKKYRKTQYK